MSYTVKSGDSLSLIAKKFGQPFSNWKQIYDLNPQIGPNPDKIYPGQSLSIPAAWENGSSQSNPEPEPQPIVKKSNSDTMNMIYIGGGLLLLYLAYKKRGRK